ncbi:hypothetical protein [Streptomyces naphthomycinicus]|uniref:hypothetical protein n=1 Tax=Streptomyces naphthomycinicus TaxID=2872625 RepID=UPI0028899A75|nr:hypothetical protein [Streptomyces sp. TML10]
MTDSTPVRPVTWWGGMPVPWIAAWTQESIPRQLLTVYHGPDGDRLGLQLESPVDRHYGVPWVRMPAVRRGRPRYELVHALRQRQAMSRLLCQLCGGPTIGSRPDDRSLWLMAARGGETLAEGQTTTAPPVHTPCARTATEHCPPLGHGWRAALVSSAPVWGVAGVIYEPGTLRQLPAREDTADGLHRVPFTSSLIHWVLAVRLVVTLHGVEPVTDLEMLDLEAPEHH